MKTYHCYTDSKAETEIIKKEKPENLMLSYYYFKNKPLSGVIEKLGYKPNIMLDSGGFSAFTKGKNIALPDYLKYLTENMEYIEHYIALDVIGDSYLSLKYYEIMLEKGFSPLPVFHYMEDNIYLCRYYRLCNGYIALGGTVPEKNKEKVIEWIKTVHSFYPDIKYHLLGKSSKEIINNVDIYSNDSST